MRPPQNVWPTTAKGRFVLLFAQLLSEMLGEFTFESYRVYSLDTLSRLDEAVALIDDVLRNRIPRDALKPALDEMLWSFDKDPVARTTASAEIAALGELVKQHALLSDLAAGIRLIQRLLKGDYKTALERHILNLFDEPNRKIELRQACGFYCTYLINVGLSKYWIEEVVQRTFFEKDMSDADRSAVESFFREFDDRTVDFEVYTPINSELAHFLPPLGFDVSTKTALSQPIQDALDGHHEPEFIHVLVSKEKAHDPYGAIDDVHGPLTSIRALTYLGREAIDCRWSQWMYVKRAADDTGRVLRKPELSFERPSDTTSGRRLKSHRNYVTRVLENFDRPSTERLLSSINTGALARTSRNKENQLISLWSAVEVLLSEPPPNTARILNYVHQIVPCVCLRHVRRQFVAVFEELLVSYRRAFADILRGESNFAAQDGHTNFAAVICLKENEALQKKLCTLCAGNPLALQRIFKLNRDYGTIAAAADAVRSHQHRVEWQIHRIYRARNQLVHLGRVPSYLDSLIMNVAEYYRGSIATILNRARKDPDRSDIDQVVSEIGIEYSILTRHFARFDRREIQRTDLHLLVGPGTSQPEQGK